MHFVLFSRHWQMTFFVAVRIIFGGYGPCRPHPKNWGDRPPLSPLVYAPARTSCNLLRISARSRPTTNDNATTNELTLPADRGASTKLMICHIYLRNITFRSLSLLSRAWTYFFRDARLQVMRSRACSGAFDVWSTDDRLTR